MIAARFCFGQNESGMGYCWIVISLYVILSVAKGWKNRSLMLWAGFRGFMMFMLMLRCFNRVCAIVSMRSIDVLL